MDFASHLQNARGIPAAEAAAIAAELNATQWGDQTQINPEPKDPFYIFTAREVLPAPNAQGIITGADGREYYVPSPQALAVTLNAQTPKARIDVQHWTEEMQNNFPEPRKNSTEAAGWALNFQAAANGAITADLHFIDEWQGSKVRDRKFLYLSPVLLCRRATREVVGIQSIGLLNNPNLPIKELNAAPAPAAPAPSILIPIPNLTTEQNAMPTQTDPAPQAAPSIQAPAAQANAAPPAPAAAPAAAPQAPAPAAPVADANAQALADENARLKKQLEDNATAEANALLDAAIKDGRIQQSQREQYMAMANAHKDGIAGGAPALRALLQDAAPNASAAPGIAADANALQNRIIDPRNIRTPSRGGTGALSATQLRACLLANVSPEQYREILAEENSAKTTHPYVKMQSLSREQIKREMVQEFNAAGQDVMAEFNNAAVTPALISDLNRLFRNEFNMGFAKPGTFAHLICMQTASTGEGNTYGFMEDLQGMREWASGDRTVRSVTSKGFKLDNKDYELTIGINRNDIEDDNVGVYMPRLQFLGESAAALADTLLASLIKGANASVCHDGQSFFDTDHPVKNNLGAAATYSNESVVDEATAKFAVLLDLSRAYKPFIHQTRTPMQFVAMDDLTDEKVFMSKQFRYGVDGRLAVGFGMYHLAYAIDRNPTRDAFKNAIIAMQGQLSADGGRPLGINPTHVLCGPSLEFTLRAMFENPGDSATMDNDMYKRLEIISTPYIDTTFNGNYS